MIDIAGVGTIAAILAVILILARVIEFLVKKIFNGKSKESSEQTVSGLTALQASELHRTYTYSLEQKLQWDYARDEIRDQSEKCDNIHDVMRDLVNAQQRTCDSIRDLVVRIDKLLDRG